MNPVPGATGSSYTTPPLTTAANYWVRVSNAVGSADSVTAAITLGAPPSITAGPQSQTVQSGHPAALSVAATGTSLTYQWYLGASGTTTSPISGATGSSYTTAPLTSTTSYWVRASNPYGVPA